MSRLIYNGLENCAWCGKRLGPQAVQQIGTSTTLRLCCVGCWSKQPTMEGRA